MRKSVLTSALFVLVGCLGCASTNPVPLEMKYSVPLREMGSRRTENITPLSEYLHIPVFKRAIDESKSYKSIEI